MEDVGERGLSGVDLDAVRLENRCVRGTCPTSAKSRVTVIRSPRVCDQASEAASVEGQVRLSSANHGPIDLGSWA